MPVMSGLAAAPASTSTESTPPSQETIDRAIATNTELFDDEPVEVDEEEVVEKTPDAKETTPKQEVVPGKETPESEVKEVPVEERIERAITEGLKKFTPEPKTKEEPEVKLTPEEEDRLLARWKPDDKFLDALDSDDSKVRLAAVYNLRDGIVKQALVMSKHLIDQARDEFRGAVAPLHQTQQQTAQERGREAFFTTYPALKGDGTTDYSDFLALAAQDLKNEGYVPKSNEDAAKTLATRAAERIKKFDPKFELGAVPAQTKPTKAKTTIPKQPVTSTGGGGGAASSTPSGKTSNRSVGSEVFD